MGEGTMGVMLIIRDRSNTHLARRKRALFYSNVSLLKGLTPQARIPNLLF